MDDSDQLLQQRRTPTSNRPLLGLTILVVEDSRFACEAMRLLCLRSGARIRRADCLRSARRHLQVYRPSVAIIDLGLPDGSGADLIADLAAAQPKVGAIIGTSGDDQAKDAAMAAGADGFIAKPIKALSVFQSAILDVLPADQQPSGPRLVTDETIEPDRLAYQDDMALAADVLSAKSNETELDYVVQFLSGVARSADDADLAHATESLAKARRNGAPFTAAAARIAGMVQERLQHKRAI